MSAREALYARRQAVSCDACHVPRWVWPVTHVDIQYLLNGEVSPFFVRRALGALAAPNPVTAAAATLRAGTGSVEASAPENSPQPWLRPERGPEVPASSVYHADSAVLRRLAVAMEVVDRGGASHRERFERGLRAMQTEVQHDWLAWKEAHPRTFASAVGVQGAHRRL